MPEDGTHEAEILTLLERAQVASETVQELAFDCLRQFRKECGSIFELSQQNTAQHLLTTGSSKGLTDITRERDERLNQARWKLKVRLEALLHTAEEKCL